MATSLFYVWATLLSPSAEDYLVAGLVKRGFAVKSINTRPPSEGAYSTECAHLAALVLEIKTPEKPPATIAEWCRDEIVDVIAKRWIWHSIVVHEVPEHTNREPVLTAWVGPSTWGYHERNDPSQALEKIDMALGEPFVR